MKENLGEEIKKLRLNSNLSQAELGEKVGCKSPTISKIESGRWLSLQMLQKICVVFGVKIKLIKNK